MDDSDGMDSVTSSMTVPLPNYLVCYSSLMHEFGCATLNEMEKYLKKTFFSNMANKPTFDAMKLLRESRSIPELEGNVEVVDQNGRKICTAQKVIVAELSPTFKAQLRFEMNQFRDSHSSKDLLVSEELLSQPKMLPPCNIHVPDFVKNESTMTLFMDSFYNLEPPYLRPMNQQRWDIAIELVRLYGYYQMTYFQEQVELQIAGEFLTFVDRSNLCPLLALAADVHAKRLGLMVLDRIVKEIKKGTPKSALSDYDDLPPECKKAIDDGVKGIKRKKGKSGKK